MALRRLGVTCGDLTTLTSQEDANALLKVLFVPALGGERDEVPISSDRPSLTLPQHLDDPKSTLRVLYCTPEKVVKSKRFFAKLEKAYKARRRTRPLLSFTATPHADSARSSARLPRRAC